MNSISTFTSSFHKSFSSSSCWCQKSNILIFKFSSFHKYFNNSLNNHCFTSTRATSNNSNIIINSTFNSFFLNIIINNITKLLIIKILINICMTNNTHVIKKTYPLTNIFLSLIKILQIISIFNNNNFLITSKFNH